MTPARAVIAGIAVVIVSALAGLLVSAALSGDGGAGGAGAPGGRLSALPGGTGEGGRQEFSPEALQGVPKGSSVVATARARSIRVHRNPGGPARTLRARRFEGRRLPLVFLVKRQRGEWVQAYLPTRPNLSTGWMRKDDVKLALTRFRVKVQLAEHRLTLFRSGKPVLRAKIAKGRAISPTPTGRYYFTDLIRPPDPKGFYGPYALGMSAHSPVYTSFAGGDGQVGLHGTDRPSVLGTDVSAGCIRVSNRVITRLAKQVPLGTPIDVSRS